MHGSKEARAAESGRPIAEGFPGAQMGKACSAGGSGLCQRRWRPETHFGAPAPPPCAASPAGPGPAGQCAALGAGAGPGDAARVAASPRVPAPAGPPRWPRPPGAVLPPGASNHLVLCRPLLLLPSIFPSLGVFSNESVLRIRWPKYWTSS